MTIIVVPKQKLKQLKGRNKKKCLTVFKCPKCKKNDVCATKKGIFVHWCEKCTKQRKNESV